MKWKSFPFCNKLSFPLVIGVNENNSIQLPPNAVPLLYDDLFPILFLFPIRLVDAFKLHQDLNVPVQKLTPGATRKVWVVCAAISRADVGWQHIEVFLCISVVFPAEHPGKFAHLDPGWTIYRHGSYRTAADVVRTVPYEPAVETSCHVSSLNWP